MGRRLGGWRWRQETLQHSAVAVSVLAHTGVRYNGQHCCWQLRLVESQTIHEGLNNEGEGKVPTQDGCSADSAPAHTVCMSRTLAGPCQYLQGTSTLQCLPKCPAPPFVSSLNCFAALSMDFRGGTNTSSSLRVACWASKLLETNKSRPRPKACLACINVARPVLRTEQSVPQSCDTTAVHTAGCCLPMQWADCVSGQLPVAFQVFSGI